MSQEAGKRNFLQSCLESLLVGGVFILLGTGLSWWGWNIVQDARTSSNWRTADGIVTSSEIRDTSDAEGDSYSPEVIYEYQVSGVSYQNDTIKFGANAYSSRR